MKKIINAKQYDTSKAQKVGEWSNDRDYRDHGWCRETLFRKRTGEYFLFGEGGPMSRYAQSCGNNAWSSGATITPLTYKAAAEWAEEHLSSDEYEEIFGKVVEDETRKTAGYVLSTTAINVLHRMSQEQGKTVSDVLDALILAANNNNKQ